ncbi:hypothetical protein [Ruminiclostridium herbifermentans]|nr:hypothetical protein [Ruminiclostridium herbifermentans]
MDSLSDKTINQAEICTDTTYHKALMDCRNQSADKAEKLLYGTG